jgi:hypothetical protein
MINGIKRKVNNPLKYRYFHCTQKTFSFEADNIDKTNALQGIVDL